MAERVVISVERPNCSGKWIAGSGGHRKHEPCGRVADWWDPGDLFAYCDEHLNQHDRARNDYQPWEPAEPKRDLCARLVEALRERDAGCCIDIYTDGSVQVTVHTSTMRFPVHDVETTDDSIIAAVLGVR